VELSVELSVHIGNSSGSVEPHISVSKIKVKRTLCCCFVEPHISVSKIKG